VPPRDNRILRDIDVFLSDQVGCSSLWRRMREGDR
jgi:hypothetical protein